VTTNNWGRWGAEDQVGAPNTISSELTVAALSLARTGELVSLAQPFGQAAPVPPHRGPGQRFMDRDAGDWALGARVVGGFKFSEDTVLISTHSGTHMDALSHVWEGDELYNGHPASAIRSTRGATKLGAEHLPGRVTRGILIDAVAMRGRPLEPSEEITVEDIERGYATANTEPQPGDCVLTRTGWWERGFAPAEYFDNEPGIGEAAADWLAAADAAYVGADNYAVEVQPSREGTRFPAHLTLLHRHGIPLIENMDLSGIAGIDRSFTLLLAPIGFAGSTAAQVNPIAVL